MLEKSQHQMGQIHSSRREERKHKYTVRILASTIGALLLVITLLRAPITADQLELGWQAKSAAAPLTLQDMTENIEPISEREVGDTPIQTLGGIGDAENLAEEAAPNLDNLLATTSASGEDEENGETSNDRRTLIDMNKLQLQMQADDRIPRLEGGMGSLYLHIRYPEAARRAGIQGLMVMQFIVEEDGTPTNIEVKQSLHPLTDSSAVRALRRVKFVPGRMSGQTVRVRMNLPVRFSLVNADGSQYTGPKEDMPEDALSHYPNLEEQ